MALKVCNGCSRITNGPLCPECRGKRNRRQYESRKARGKRTGTTSEYRTNRAKALERAGGRCEYFHEGIRCIETTSLECHHINGEHHDHRPENLTVLCHGHHMTVEAGRRSQS